MAFYINGNRLQEGVSFYDANGTQYPANWLNLSTEAEKAAIGITWVADPVRADDRFYWDGNIDNPKDLDVLKTTFKAQVKDTANKLLAQTDWYVIRKAEREISVPMTIADQRSIIIYETSRLETAIDGVANVEELIEVLNNQNWGA
jgi:hypothetical protein